MGSVYTQVEDYLLPTLALPEEGQKPIGILGQGECWWHSDCKPTEPAGETSPLDGAQRRKNGGLLHLAIRRSASQSTHTWLLDHISVHFVPEKIFQLLNSQI